MTTRWCGRHQDTASARPEVKLLERDDEAGAARDSRVLVVSYEELKADLRSAIGRVNAHCGFGLSEARLDELLPRFEFSWMRAREEQFNPRSVRWVQREGAEGDFHFIRAGRVGDGRAAFASAERKEALERMVRKTFPHGAPDHVKRLLP